MRNPKVGTHGSQLGDHTLPLQGAASSQRLEDMVANVATIGCDCREVMATNLGTRSYHCKELPVARMGTPGCQLWNQWLPMQGTADSQRLELMVRYRFVLFSEPVAKRFCFA